MGFICLNNSCSLLGIHLTVMHMYIGEDLLTDCMSSVGDVVGDGWVWARVWYIMGPPASLVYCMMVWYSWGSLLGLCVYDGLVYHGAVCKACVSMMACSQGMHTLYTTWCTTRVRKHLHCLCDTFCMCTTGSHDMAGTFHGHAAVSWSGCTGWQRGRQL